jgi:hypothetical protein
MCIRLPPVTLSLLARVLCHGTLVETGADRFPPVPSAELSLAVGRRLEHDGHAARAAARATQARCQHSQRKLAAPRPKEGRQVEGVAMHAFSDRLHAVACTERAARRQGPAEIVGFAKCAHHAQSPFPGQRGRSSGFTNSPFGKCTDDGRTPATRDLTEAPELNRSANEVPTEWPNKEQKANLVNEFFFAAWSNNGTSPRSV